MSHLPGAASFSVTYANFSDSFLECRDGVPSTKPLNSGDTMCTQCGNPSANHPPAWSRRHFLKLAGGMAAGLALPSRALLAAGEMPKPENVISPDEALDRLKAG